MTESIVEPDADAFDEDPESVDLPADPGGGDYIQNGDGQDPESAQ